MTRLTLGVVGFLMFATSVLAQGAPGTRAAAAGRAGWEAIRAGRSQDAAAAFAEAIEAERRDPSLYLGAGLAAHVPRTGHHRCFVHPGTVPRHHALAGLGGCGL